MGNEENRGLVNKKASNDQLVSFDRFWQSSFLLSFSLILLERESFLRALLVDVTYLDSWRNKAKEEQESTRGHQDQQLHQICLQVLNCMYDFFISFGMHATCMWFLIYDLSLAWRMVGNDSGLPSVAISWITMVIVGLFSLFCFSWFSCFLSLG